MSDSTPDLSTAIAYHLDGFPPERLDYERLAKPLAAAASALSRFDQVLLSLRNSEFLLAPLRNQEAVISSRMEGTISTIDEIFEYEAAIADGGDGASNFRSDVVETVLYQRALKAAQSALEDGRPFSEWLVRSMHQTLLSFGRGATKNPGQYKTEQNYIGDRLKRRIFFVPIAPERLRDGLERLFDYLEKDVSQTLVKTAVSHVEFEALHPFEDGNGRVGRMLITLFLWRQEEISEPHFYISGFLEDNKAEYIERMRRVSSHNEWTEWCVFFLTAIENQALRNLETAMAIQTLYEQSKSQFSEALSSKWTMQALDFIFANPIFRINKFVRETEITDASARRFVKALQDKKILSCLEEPAGRRPARYAFEPLLEIVRV